MTPTEIIKLNSDNFWRWWGKTSPQQPGVKRRVKRAKEPISQGVSPP